MNRKGICKVLKHKHEDFLLSIEDLAVRKLVAENSLITGGAIASMLLREKVNDYDYYFRDLDTVRAVAKYYCNQFIKNNPGEIKLQPTVTESDGRVKIKVPSVGLATESDTSPYQYFESRPQDEATDFVDAATNVIADADEVPAKELEFSFNILSSNLPKKKYRPIFMTSNAITLANGVQLIIRFYGDPAEIHENYDFVHCTNYWTSNDNKLTLRADAMESLLSKHLTYVGSKYPLCSVIRTRKFIRRGWHINAGQYIKMLFQVSELNLKDINILEDQLTGVDNAYFYQIIEWFKKKKEEDSSFQIDSTYLASIIDKIF